MSPLTQNVVTHSFDWFLFHLTGVPLFSSLYEGMKTGYLGHILKYKGHRQQLQPAQYMRRIELYFLSNKHDPCGDTTSHIREHNCHQ